MSEELIGSRIHISGIVQGVGFRPFIFSLAQRYSLSGWVCNTSAGVDIALDGHPQHLEAFVEAIKSQAPPLAHIEQIEITPSPPNGFTKFEILHSQEQAGEFQPISPDVSICSDCLRELFNPHDRRYRYPFINCTNCGPRFTIITDIPYDRPKTTMAPFEMCPECSAEYDNPLDRRFHAQPVACPRCGPHVWLENNNLEEKSTNASGHGFPKDEEAIQQTRRMLSHGDIVAIKGLGGFHLACDATNTEAVAELRRRKLRVDKPFALMFPDIKTVEKHCFLNEAECELLASRQRPILILWRRPSSTISLQVAPLQDTIGGMLPYTPLHYLLLEPEPGFPEALVMTSGNLCEEPIATDNAEASQRLRSLADAFLMHNRDIHTRCDDSVVRIRRSAPEVQVNYSQAAIYPLRRSRGYAPFPVLLPQEAPPLLATGAELKNTFCLARGRYAFLSQHIGDMENYETLRSFEEGIRHFERLFRVQPQAIAHDLHPDYLASRYAQERAAQERLPTIGVQHHHAHITACMAEHGLRADHPVIGFSFDGTGYGDDGAIWGGEVLLANYRGYQRVYHLDYVPLPGGDVAVRQPWRMALSWLHKSNLEWEASLPPVKHAGDHMAVIYNQLRTGLNAPLTSSMGRLFDAVSALAGVRQEVNYEAQAAIEFEALVDADEQAAYPFTLTSSTIDPTPVITSIVTDIQHAQPTPKIAARFHNGLAQLVAKISLTIRSRFSVNEVALSGGVWQNITLLEKTVPLLQEEGFTVYIHSKVPANDGGLALGQAI
ncbi:MAG: carbamoyltransferase HypF, partial [Chloroflexota bacterium]